MPNSQVVESATVTNLRDLGGISLPNGGRVRPRTAFRSGQLDRLDPRGDPAVAALGIRTVVDLRTAFERASRPDRVPAGANLLVADVMADTSGAGAANRLGAAMADPATANRTLGGGRARQALEKDYRGFVTSASARAAYKQLLTALARPEGGPVLFHCTAGKDRTGWGASLILLLLGADRRTVLAEYLAAGPAVRAAFAPQVAAFTSAGGDPEIADAVIGVHPSYLEAAIGTMTDVWGDVESYVRAGLGLKDETVDALRARLTA